MRAVALPLAAALLAAVVPHAFADERVEVITYVPATSPGDFDRLHANRATIGPTYSLTSPVTLNNGTLLVWDRVGIGLGSAGTFSASPPTRRLVVRGPDNAVGVAAFLAGTDTSPFGDTDMRVGIGTDNPGAELDVYAASDAVFARFWGASDNENYVGINLRSEQGAAGIAGDFMWQIGHKAVNMMNGINANDLHFALRDEDAGTWTYPMVLSRTGRLGLGLTPTDPDISGIWRLRPGARLHVYEPNHLGARVTTTTDNCGILVTSVLSVNSFMPGIYWAMHGGSVRSPIAGVYARQRHAAEPYAGELHFGVSNSSVAGINVNAMMIDEDGRIGIATDDPGDHVHLISTNGNNHMRVRPLDTAFANYMNALGLIFDNNGAEDVYIDFNAHGGGAEAAQEFYGRIWYKNDSAGGDPDGMAFFGGRPSGIPFAGSPITDAHMFIDFDGDVGIGTTAPAYRLDVAGDINVTGDVRKSGTAYAHPDYVFEPGYPLMPLDQLRGYLAANRRLPNMPSAEQVRKDGVRVFEHNRLLLEKTEEAYLYLLGMEQRLLDVERLQQRNDALKAERRELEQRLLRLERALAEPERR